MEREGAMDKGACDRPHVLRDFDAAQEEKQAVVQWHRWKRTLSDLIKKV